MSGDLKKIVMEAADLPTIPTVAKKVVKALSNPNTNINDLNKIISTDQALSARVLKIANSAMYYCQREIKSLGMAMSRIGFASLKSIVIAVSTKDIYKTFGEPEKLLWEHSVGASIAAQTVANALGGFKADEIFTGGLMHDIGKTLLNNKDPKKYSQVFQEVHEGGKSFAEVERAIYDYTHAEVGSLLINKWNLPEILTEVIRIHHDLDSQETIPQVELRTAAVINLADLICLKLGIGYKQPANGFNVADSASAKILGVDEGRIEKLIIQTDTDFQNNKEVFL
jgi:putative nucleotidyltransferase with HDIG domain